MPNVIQALVIQLQLDLLQLVIVALTHTTGVRLRVIQLHLQAAMDQTGQGIARLIQARATNLQHQVVIKVVGINPTGSLLVVEAIMVAVLLLLVFLITIEIIIHQAITSHVLRRDHRTMMALIIAKAKRLPSHVQVPINHVARGLLLLQEAIIVEIAVLLAVVHLLILHPIQAVLALVDLAVVAVLARQAVVPEEEVLVLHRVVDVDNN